MRNTLLHNPLLLGFTHHDVFHNRVLRVVEHRARAHWDLRCLRLLFVNRSLLLVEEERHELLLHQTEVALKGPAHVVPHRLLQERHQREVRWVELGSLRERASWVGRWDCALLAVADGHDDDVDGVEDEIDLVGLLAEGVGRLGHRAAVEVQGCWCLARIKAASLHLLSLLPSAKRLVVLLNERRGSAVCVAWVLLNLQRRNACVLQKVC